MFSRRLLSVGMGAAMLLVMETTVHASNFLKRADVPSSSGTSGNGSSSSGSSTSQTATAATTATAQSATTAALAQHAQSSWLRSAQQLQAMQAAQSAARMANLGISGLTLPTVSDGLATGGLVPTGSVAASTSDPNNTMQFVPIQLTNNVNSQVSFTKGGAITLPSGTPGNDQVTVSGSGTITTTSGTTPFSGTVTTSLPVGSSISFSGNSSINFASGTGGFIPVLLTSNSNANFVTANVLPSNWSGIEGLSQSASSSSGPVIVTLQQNQQQALLNWQTFNIGKNTTLDFDQSLGGANVGEWVAINKVAANIAPSQILGSIQAPGQVYVLNQNGIIFGGASQVNVHSLAASSLPINDNLSDPTTGRGLLNNPDLQFLFSQVNMPAGTLGPTPAFTPAAPPTSGKVVALDSNGNPQIVAASGRDGDVVVQAGAQLSSPTTPEHVGGRIALMGPNVNNAGTISTPDGQTILAAGNQVAWMAHDANDPSLRGLDVAIGSVDSSSGTASNTGLIEAPRADVTIAGKTVNQLGVIDSSTSVALNGRIDLLANYNTAALINGVNGFSGVSGLYPAASGTVTFGPQSLTQILPELASADTVVGTQLALPSQINVQGLALHLAGNSEILAPSARLTFNAGSWVPDTVGGTAFIYSTGQVYLDSGATIDVSGSENVNASVTDNIISVQLLGTELANSPLQQNGPLRGQTVQVDIRQTGTYNGQTWIGTPLGNVSGYVGLVQRTVGELTTGGGSVVINAGDSVVAQAGSSINVSGGWINYQGGTVQTTKVVSGGQIYDISQATPNLVYNGIYTGDTTTSAKWGISQTTANSLLTGAHYEQGYIQGGNGGSLSITAPSMALDGKLFGNTVAGSRQRTTVAQLTSTYASASFLPTTLSISAVPVSSKLSLQFQAQDPTSFSTYSPTPPNVLFQNGASGQASADPFALDASGNPKSLRADRKADVVLSPDLINVDGFDTFTINNSDGKITVPAGVSLTSSADGSISMLGANIDIEGNITAAGGSLNFTVYDFTPYITLASGDNTPPPDSARGNFKLGATASLSTAGLIVDDRPTSASPNSLPLETSGGTVAINSYSADLLSGSRINASGGVAVSASGKATYGNGGHMTIQAGQDPNVLSLIGGHLNLGASLAAYSGSKGGALTIQAPLIQIGGAAVDPANTLLLSPTFFSQGGFGSFTLNGLGEVAPNQADPNLYLPAVSIAAGTVINPVAQSWVGSFNGNEVFLTSMLLPSSVERTPVSLNFGALGVTNALQNQLIVRGDFVMGKGASITTDPQIDPQGGVAIKGQTVAIEGSIVAPGGTIAIIGGPSFAATSPTTEPLPTVDLGPTSFLSTAGTTVFTPNPYGYTTGSVLAGGNINVSGNIVAEAGAVLNVSGASSMLDVAPGYVSGGAANNQSIPLSLVSTRVDSNGGSITLKGGQELFTDATFIGAAGGPTAQGGSLSVSSGHFVSPTSPTTSPLDVTLVVTQNGTNIPLPGYYPAGQTAIGNAVVDTHGNIISGRGYFSADSFNNPASGFDSLTLGGTVQFSGPVTLTARRSLTVGTGGFIYTDPTVGNSSITLNAPYVSLGQSFQGPLTAQEQQLPIFFDSNNNPVYAPPTYGTGSLQINASDLIDVGNLSLQNIGAVNLNVANGAIRGDGTFDVSGAIVMTAGQIYPPTESIFTVAAYDHGGTAGSVTIATPGNGQLPQLPLSAGGTLNIYASTITQGGVLRAPLGAINLGSGVTSANPTDPLSGETVNPTRQLTLTSGSVTSVSAVDPTTGQALTIPYGINVNGVSWIDPSGTDITLGGVPGKSVSVSAVNVADKSGASIDISGGGDLYAYQFVSGTGGTNDILASSSSFAVIPGYQADYAPVAPYNTATGNFGADQGYVNGSLSVGSQVYLAASSGLPAGMYTLLPARYALLPGAFLVTPKSGIPAATTVQPDGSSLVSGYRFNGLTPPVGQPLNALFEVDPQSVVRARAEYDNFSANSFLGQSAQAANVAVPRLPVDAGQLMLAARSTMTIQGTVSSHVPAGGLGSLVDIASPSDILVSGPNTNLSGVPATTLVLDSSGLSAFGADSLLIGGYRSSALGGTAVTVTTNNLTVDNSGAPLTGPDVILASNKNLTVDPNADIEQTGSLSTQAVTLLFGNSTVTGSGDGALIRVSSDPTARIIRSGVSGSTVPAMTIGAGATIKGANLTLDSTYATSLDPGASLSGNAVSLNSGQVSLVLTPPGTPLTTAGLVLSSADLQSLQSTTKSLSLLSYSSIDIYGSGQIGGGPNASGQYPIASLALHAAGIRGNGGAVTINAQDISIDNSPSGTLPGTGLPSSPGGTLAFNAGVVQLGAQGQTSANGLSVQGYDDLNVTASGGILLQGAGSVTQSDGTVVRGAFGLTTSGNLTMTTPLITGATAANQTITAGGILTINPAGGTAATVAGGLGASVAFVGQTIIDNSAITLRSGTLSMESKTGDVTLGGTLDVTGKAQPFFDLIKYTSGGQVTLTSDNGSVNLMNGSKVDVSANSGGGNAGSLKVNASKGTFTDNGTLFGQGGTGGQQGAFSLDVGSMAGGSLQSLDTGLNAHGFTQSISIRDRTDSALSIDGTVRAAAYHVSADAGSITVNGTIDASNVAAIDSLGNAIQVGGTIDLTVNGNITLANGSLLTVEGKDFSNAGKGGTVTLDAGSETNGNAGAGFIDIAQGSRIVLTVGANNGDVATTAGNAALGKLSGTLHLRAPQMAGNTDLQINPINGAIVDASSIIVEGYKIDAPAAGSIDSIEGSVISNGTTFAGNTAAITNRLLANNGGLASVLNVEPGAEIINATGDLTLTKSWDLSTFRFGPNNVPGVLTLRADGNLVFNFKASLSDGFVQGSSNGLWQATLMPVGTRSWTYDLAAGADFSAVDFHQVQSLASLAPNTGSLLLGKNSIPLPTTGNLDSQTTIVPTYFQVIRTGTGDIDISTGRDVQLLNSLATIYTAGTQAAPMANFATPILTYKSSTLGTTQLPTYPAQYSLAGGDVTISAQNDIAHYLVNSSGNNIEDSSKELPTNWLYRRGYVSRTTGQFATTHVGGEVESTSWWVNFSNFFEGIGALGGGNVTLAAGHDVSNVDAVVPTNARMPKGTPNAANLVELGGGDLVVRAGNDINGGVYYVERGQGTVAAGNSIFTNATRAALTRVAAATTDPSTWLPTTLFLGKGSFDVSAGNSLLLGPVANPFLLPQGINNSFFDKTYFSTYAMTDTVDASALTGTVILKDNADGGSGSLADWYQNILLQYSNPDSFSQIEPWLRLVETKITPFDTAAALLPSTLRVTAFSGDIDTIGGLVLSPSPNGTIDLAATGSINGIQSNGVSNPIQPASATNSYVWGSTTINLSDANPASIPGVASPISFSSPATGLFGTFWNFTEPSIFTNLIALFNETGATNGVLQARQALHTPGLLHANDTNPLHLYALNGDISGVTLYSGKATQVVAGRDITDIALYVQNDNAGAISLVNAGRDIVAYDPVSPLREAAQASGNQFIGQTPQTPEGQGLGAPTAGDIQISGPGALEVLAGRNFNLGVGPSNSDGTQLGLTSIGNARDPYLPFGGASIIAGAGIDGSGGLESLNFGNISLRNGIFTIDDPTSFIGQFLDPATGGAQATRYLPDLATLMGLPSSDTSDQIWAAFGQLPKQQQDARALDIFYLVLRDAGRDHNDPASPTAGSFVEGNAAIKALFPSTTPWAGDISLTSREIKTESGGDISLIAPGGQLTVGFDLSGNQAVDQGILTEDGGNINIFANKNINVGTSRIFTLRGGNEIIWSTLGDIAAGSSSKTIQSAPPTRVLIDPQSADVQTDLAGLATGGGIGVLETVAGAPPSNVDLIAPNGTINAGDAGIRASGNLNIAAVQVLNAGNIQVGGKSSGVPTAATAPSIGSLSAASSAAGAASNAASDVARRNSQQAQSQQDVPSIISVAVVGYGGDDLND